MNAVMPNWHWYLCNGTVEHAEEAAAQLCLFDVRNDQFERQTQAWRRRWQRWWTSKSRAGSTSQSKIALCTRRRIQSCNKAFERRSCTEGTFVFVNKKLK